MKETVKVEVEVKITCDSKSEDSGSKDSGPVDRDPSTGWSYHRGEIKDSKPDEHGWTDEMYRAMFGD